MITNERKISTQVIASDGEIIVLGGLIRDDVQKSQNKVPLFRRCSIPWQAIPQWFHVDYKEQSNGIFAASIIRDEESLIGATAEKYRYVRELQRRDRQRGAIMVENERIPLLPTWDEAVEGAQLINSPAKQATVEEQRE